MSGPKVINYNMTAFKGRLKEYIRMQTKLAGIRNELLSATIHDDEQNIHFDGRENLNRIDSEIQKALRPMVFDQKGNIDEKTYKTIENQISDHTKQLKEILAISEEIHSDFLNREKDYTSYKEYLSFFENAKSAFEKFKIEMNEDTEKNFKKDFLIIAQEALNKFGSVMIEEKKTAFDWGFDQLTEGQKKTIFDHVTDKENQIREIRDEMLNKILSSGTGNKPTTEKPIARNKRSAEVNRVSQKIKLLITNCNDKKIADEYRVRFEKLEKSESMNDLFFYQELHDSLLEKETTRKNRLLIKNRIVVLNRVQNDQSLDSEKKEIQKKLIKLIDTQLVSDKETSELETVINEFFKKTNQIKDDLEVKKKEQLFIKTRIIQNFESMGYTVMEDLEVIDFEKESDFYLQAPGQENILNIKFKDDGSFRYVFQIPQKKEDLSTDEQKMKLHEMKTTCDDFVLVLNDLKNMGVDIDIKSDKPIESASMITISDAVSNKIKTSQKQAKRLEQIKKLYLE
jgi:hypothetical protein